MIRRPVVASVLLASALLAFFAFADDFQPATVVDAGNGTGRVGERIGNVLAVHLGSLKITAEYETFARSSKSASQFIVGDTVQARVDGKWLYFVGSSGKTIKARIVRQERLAQ